MNNQALVSATSTTLRSDIHHSHPGNQAPMKSDRQQHPEHGSVMVAALFVVIVLGGLVTLINQSAVSSHRATLRNDMETKLLYIAEAGIDFQGTLLAIDSLGPVKDTSKFSYDPDTDEFVGVETEFGTVGGISRPFQVRIQYLLGTDTVTFSDRHDPTEAWDRIRLTSTATLGPLKRQVRAWYAMRFSTGHTGAIVSDAISTGSAFGKSGAALGNTVIDDLGRPGQHHLHGCVRANGPVAYGTATGGGSNSLTNNSADGSCQQSTIGSLTGCFHDKLVGTGQEVPDFTESGGNEQLFNIKRLVAAATASSNVYNSLGDFAQACNTANASDTNLEGIVLVNIDSDAEGSNPTIDETGDLAIPDGINIVGTLVFRFSNGTDRNYRIKIDTPMNINAANLSGLAPSKVATCATGFPPCYSDANKDPVNLNIQPDFANFRASDRFPALVYTNGIIDLEDAVNISGLVYGPGLIEIENKAGKIQYINGEVYAGGGVYIEGHASTGFTVIKFDENSVMNLVTQDSKARELVRTGFVILR